MEASRWAFSAYRCILCAALSFLLFSWRNDRNSPLILTRPSGFTAQWTWVQAFIVFWPTNYISVCESRINVWKLVCKRLKCSHAHMYPDNCFLRMFQLNVEHESCHLHRNWNRGWYNANKCTYLTASIIQTGFCCCLLVIFSHEFVAVCSITLLTGHFYSFLPILVSPEIPLCEKCREYCPLMLIYCMLCINLHCECFCQKFCLCTLL